MADKIIPPEYLEIASALRDMLAAMREVPLGPQFTAVLGRPHEYAGGDRWAELMTDEVLPRLPEELRADATRRVRNALELEPVPPSLVHSDLGGENVHWSADGKLVGILDWDLAQPFDPAVDAACLAWYGWENVRTAVDPDTYRRAGIWYLTFGIEQIVAAVLTAEPPEVLDRYVERTAAWLKRTADWRLP